MHLKKNRLPDRVLDAPEISHLTVITEPGHEQPYGPEVDVRLVDSIQDIELVRTVLLDVLRTRRIDGFLTPFELGQSQAGYLRSFFAIPGIGAEVALNFANKYVMKSKLAAAGLPVANFRLAHGLEQVPDAAAELGWPVVTKPVTGGGTHDLCVFKSLEEFEEFTRSDASQVIRNLRVPLIVEEFVPLTGEFHCDGVVYGGRRYSRPRPATWTRSCTTTRSSGPRCCLPATRCAPRSRTCTRRSSRSWGSTPE